MSEIGWLPNEPERFFGLSEPYDRRALKRAYGKAIRKYSPETHPREFQLIHEAYQGLERALRYKGKERSEQHVVDAWTPERESPTASSDTASVARDPRERQAPTESSADQRAAGETAAARSRMSLRQLAVADPAAALEHIRSQTRRTPQDYFLAAVLADAVTGKPSPSYLGHLLDGLAEHPGDPGLIALVSEYLDHEVPEAQLAETLKLLSGKLRNPLFYMLSETLWLRLLSTAPFDQCERLLQECERPIRQIDPTARVVFYMRLLQSAIWEAPVSWTDQVVSMLESQSATMDDQAQFELEFLHHLRMLIREVPFPNVTDPVREQLLKAFRIYCQSTESASSGVIIRMLVDLGRDAKAVQRAFPPDDSGQNEHWVAATNLLVSQMHSIVAAPPSLDGNALHQQTQQLVRDLEMTLNAVVSGHNRAESRYRTTPMVIWLLFGTIVGAFPIMIIAALGGRSGAVIALLGIVALFAGLLWSYYRVVYPKFLKPKQEHYANRWMLNDYGRHWRGRLFRYVRAGNGSTADLLGRIHAVAHAMKRTGVSQMLHFFWVRDAGLCIYTSLRTLMR